MLHPRERCEAKSEEENEEETVCTRSCLYEYWSRTEVHHLVLLEDNKAQEEEKEEKKNGCNERNQQLHRNTLS